MTLVPLIGPSYNLDSRPASVQRTVNLMPVPLEPGNERAGWVLKDVPGLVEFEEPPLTPCEQAALLLIHGGGTNGSNSFTDFSLYEHVVVAEGASAYGNTYTFNGQTMFHIPGSVGDAVAIAYESEFAPGDGDFCIEFAFAWAEASIRTIFQLVDTSSRWPILIGAEAAPNLRFWVGWNGATYALQITAPALDIGNGETWYGVFQRSGDTFSILLGPEGGTLTEIGSGTYAGSISFEPTARLVLGKFTGSVPEQSANVWMSEVRWTSCAHYEDGDPVPTAPHPNPVPA